VEVPLGDARIATDANLKTPQDVAVDAAGNTGDARTYTFSPNGGVPATGVSRVSVVTPVPASRGAAS
jgi:hypothetical protein